MKFFLLGAHEQNAGPSNVNKSIIRQGGGNIRYTNFHNKYMRNIETALYIINSKRVLISGSCAPRFYWLLQLFHKKYFYMMHGCIQYENVINKLNVSPKILNIEENILKNANRIICVSEGYAEWVRNRYPAYKDKITFVNNGINLMQRQKVEKASYTIAVSGGNRCIKNNLEVYRAVKLLNKEGIPCRMFIFGRKYQDNDVIPENGFVTYCGHLDKDIYYQKLDKIACFVLNSEVEPFGLVVADALNCNCSLIMSKNVGAKCIMQINEQDIIQNPHDAKEIAEKIKNIFQHSNSERLYQSIDVEDCSEAAAYEKLKKIIEE